MRQYLIVALGLSSLGLSLGLAITAPAQAAPTFNVNSTVDAGDKLPGDGKCESKSLGLGRLTKSKTPLKIIPKTSLYRWQANDLLAGQIQATVKPDYTITQIARKCTLRAAIEESNATATGTPIINVPAGTYTLTKGQLAITRSVHVRGADESTTIVDGGDSSRHLYIGNEAKMVYAYISRMSFINGRNNDSFQAAGSIWIRPDTYVSLYKTIVRDNYSAVRGGGIYVDGELQMSQSTVSNNAVQMDQGGGQMYSGGGLMMSSGARVKILKSTISDNKASRGGGIRNGGGNLKIDNSTISGNRVSFRGGGIMTYGKTEISQSTITNNKANQPDGNAFGNEDKAGGGIYNDTGLLFVSRSIVAGNTDNQWSGAAKYSPDCYSKPVPSYGNKRILISFRGNVIGVSNDNCKVYDYSWGLSGNFDQVGTDASPLNPLLGILTNNGGPTKTHMPNAASPAVDDGSGYEFSFADVDKDQRGASRPVGAKPDAGAVERGGVIPAE